MNGFSSWLSISQVDWQEKRLIWWSAARQWLWWVGLKQGTLFVQDLERQELCPSSSKQICNHIWKVISDCWNCLCYPSWWSNSSEGTDLGQVCKYKAGYCGIEALETTKNELQFQMSLFVETTLANQLQFGIKIFLS